MLTMSFSAPDPMYGPTVRCKGFFVDLVGHRSCINVSGLSLERCSGPSRISARVRSHQRIGLNQAIWVTSARMRREDADPGRRRETNSCRYRCPWWQLTDLRYVAWRCSYSALAPLAVYSGARGARPDHSINGHGTSIYRHAMTEFLFDLNQIQNFRL
jgi:hypothetical protein